MDTQKIDGPILKYKHGETRSYSAGLFLFFGYRSWRDADSEEDDGTDAAPAKGGLATSFTMIFVAELGDKTQLAMIALVAGTERMILQRSDSPSASLYAARASLGGQRRCEAAQGNGCVVRP